MIDWQIYLTALHFVLYAMPLFLAVVAWHLWIHYIQAHYIASLQFVLLEIKLPKEVLKTPQAMEIALGALHQGWDNDNFIKAWTLGQLRTWFSLEMVSFGGEIHFYIWTQKMFQNIIEAQFYAQYPGIEIVPAEDYVHNVPYDVPGSPWKLWGIEFKLSKEDAYPIKTYVDYGLDKPASDSDAAFVQVDPMTATIEYLGSIEPHEQIWVQILVQAAKDRSHKAGTWFGREGWKDQGKKLVEKLMQRDKKGTDEFGMPILSPRERVVVESVERSLAKPAFDVGIRTLYLTHDKVNPARIVATLGSFKQYNAADMNGFKTGKTTGFKYPWQDLTGRRTAKKKAVMFDAYRRRSYFYPPHVRTPFVLSAEELATIFHLPGRVAMTPSLAKIESKRAEPPVNLPI